MPRSEVRIAKAADASEIGRLMHDFNTEYEEPVPPATVVGERIAGHIERGDAIVLLGGEGPDGLAVLRLRPALYDEGLDTYLEELYVAPANRGEGLGRALLEAAMDAARAEGATRIELGTAETDEAARGLYESCGFTNREGKPDGPAMLYYERDL